MVLQKIRNYHWPRELLLIPLLFTLSGICFVLMVLTPDLPPPYYLTLNAYWGNAGALLLALGIWLTYRLHICIQALSSNEKPDYRHTDRTFLILFLILIFYLLAVDFYIIYFIIGIPPMPPPPSP